MPPFCRARYTRLSPPANPAVTTNISPRTSLLSWTQLTCQQGLASHADVSLNMSETSRCVGSAVNPFNPLIARLYLSARSRSPQEPPLAPPLEPPEKRPHTSTAFVSPSAARRRPSMLSRSRRPFDGSCAI